MENVDHLTDGIKELKKLNNAIIYVGIPWADDHLTMIALVQETGATIRPKNGQWLCIPATKEMVGKSPKDVPKLFRTKGKNVLATSDGNGGLDIKFILKKSVTIPPRPFLRTTKSQFNDKWVGILQKQTSQILVGQSTADETIEMIGKQAVKEMKKIISQFSTPPNANLTQQLKGFNNPLIDTGKMMESVFYAVEK